MALATCAVVGAGIAALSAAEVLRARGVTVVVLEKSRGVGGGLATRRIIAPAVATGAADHGAQFFTAHSSEFRARAEARPRGVYAARLRGRCLCRRTR